MARETRAELKWRIAERDAEIRKLKAALHRERVRRTEAIRRPQAHGQRSADAR